MARKYKQGWYRLINKDKFILPSDGFMNSYKEENGESYLNFKSSFELKAFRFADSNPAIVKFSIEPFAIKYLKPTDAKIHRYYIDMYLEFKSGDKFLVEIKPYSETIPPKQPKRLTQKSQINYQKAISTYLINQAKWAAAKEFAQKNNMRFIILTERELNL